MREELLVVSPIRRGGLSWQQSLWPAATVCFHGLGYSAAGLGCTGPILAGLTVFALSTGGFGTALSAFVVFSATMGG